MSATNLFEADVTEGELKNPDVWAIGRRVLRFTLLRGNAITKKNRARILAEETDIEAVIALLKEAAPIDEIERQSPLLQAKIRGVERRRAMIEEAGGALSSTETAALLGITRQAVEKRLKAGSLLGLRVGSKTAVPSFQIANGGLLPGLSKVLRTLSISDPWMRFNFFLTKDKRLNGKTPAELLRTGRSEQMVLAAARAYGEHGAI